MSSSGAATTTQPGSRGDAPFAYEVIARVAPRLGIALDLEPFGREAARLRFPDGRIAYFRHGNLDINGSGTADIARDKHACAHFLAAAGIAVPPSLAIPQPSRNLPIPHESLTAFAAEHGWPLIVLSDGATVSMLRTFASGYRFTSSLPAEVAAGLLVSLRIMKE